jgi:hypothetical protein
MRVAMYRCPPVVAESYRTGSGRSLFAGSHFSFKLPNESHERWARVHCSGDDEARLPSLRRRPMRCHGVARGHCTVKLIQFGQKES